MMDIFCTLSTSAYGPEEGFSIFLSLNSGVGEALQFSHESGAMESLTWLYLCQKHTHIQSGFQSLGVLYLSPQSGNWWLKRW